MSYGDFKDLTRRTVSHKILRYKALNIAKNTKFDEYQKDFPSMAYKFFYKKTASGAATLANKSAVKNENISNKELAEKLQKSIIKKKNNRKICSYFIDNIWGADLANMQLISKFNKGFKLLLCVVEIFIKYAWVIPLKDKKGIIITNAFQKILDECNRKPNKIWVHKSSKFYSRSMKLWLEKNIIEIY